MNKVIKKIRETFKVGEPIFPKEINGLFDLSRQQINNSIREGIKLGQIKRNGEYYYIPKYEKVCGIEYDNAPSLDSVIKKKYIEDKNGIKGIYARRTLENKMNISEQVPFVEEIVTNEVKRAKVEKTINNNRIIIRKAYTKITNDNFKVYILLELCNNASEEMLKENRTLLLNYIKNNMITKNDIEKISEVFPKKAKKKLIIGGIYE